MTSGVEYSQWHDYVAKGVRNKSLTKLMWLDIKLFEMHREYRENIPKELKEERLVGYSTFLRDKNRLKDIERILDCSERTARDYMEAVFYFSLYGVSKYSIIKRIEMRESVEKE